MDASFNSTIKHIQSATIIGEKLALYSSRMAEVVAGSKENLRRQPPLSSLVCTIAPLGQDKEGVVSVAPFMKENSQSEQRDVLFSLNAGIMINSGYVVAIMTGNLSQLWSPMLTLNPESGEAYRAAMAVALGFDLVALIPITRIRQQGIKPEFRSSEGIKGLQFPSFSTPRMDSYH